MKKRRVKEFGETAGRPHPKSGNLTTVQKYTRESFNLFWTKVVYLQSPLIYSTSPLLITHFFVESTFVIIIYRQNQLYWSKL